MPDQKPLIMRKFYSLLIIFFVAISANALDIPQGTFYFDNSLTKYSNVKFVYGSDSKPETHVQSMTHDEGNRWKITIPQTVTDMYRYTFANTSLADGKIEKTFSTVKEEISKTYNENRTATTDKTIIVGGIFVPETGDNWAQGNWTTLNTTAYSGTLPVLFITTENNTPVTSKEYYINATYYLDNMGIDSYKSFGSVDNQLPLEIRGRGNYTWNGFDKKPYRIKLGEKAQLLGMNKSRHFALLAHADDNLAFLRNTVGFELSRRLGLAYTPAQKPVEVVLNGEYIGLYFLTETIRVATDRVNIVEQADSATSANEITGGWLVEIDNYDEDLQVRITEGNGELIRFTYKTPEILSPEQESYLQNQMTSIDNAIYTIDKNSTSWENYIDIDTLARFYIIQEIMDNAESFHGSCYLHKENGNTKWIFGPVWDFGNSYHRDYQEFIYQNPPFGQTWIGEIAKFPRFQQKVIDVWKNFRNNNFAGLDNFIDNFINEISIAAQYNATRWSQYGNSNLNSGKDAFNTRLKNRIDWLVSKWGDGAGLNSTIANDNNIIITSTGNGIISISATETIENITVYDLTGKIIINTSPRNNNHQLYCNKGIYIISAQTATQLTTSKLIVK